MSDTTMWVASAIRDARERRGWSQTELASRLNKTQTAVSYWESGKRVPGLDDIVELADALDVAPESFLPSSRSRQPVMALLRATAERLADADLQQAVDDLVCEAEGTTLPTPQIDIAAAGASNAANELIEKAGLRQAPIDVDELSRLCGALVIYRPFPDSLSGMVFEYSDAAVIGINRSHHRNRQRFSLGHELGHFLLGHHRTSRGDEDRVHIDTSEGMPPWFDWRAERAANDFAAELLMPRRFISAAFKLNDNPRDLAEEFGVSELAMGYRLVNLGLR